MQSHQDKYKLWSELTIEQQLNCVCDTLAKSAVTRSLQPAHIRTTTLRLPCESAAVVISGIKQTSDVATEARFALGFKEAEKFYTTPIGTINDRGRRSRHGGLGWSKNAFHAVDWRALDATLDKKPQMYKQWLAKQCSGFCGTQHMVAHWDPTRDGLCPDCNNPERASHLNLCPDADRTRLLHSMADNLEKWLSDNHGHPDLIYWLPRYIKLRGTRQLSDFPMLSPEMQQIARSQDLIPWTSFMEGKLCKEIFKLQKATLLCSPSRLTIVDWAKRLISQILQMSHGQWVFRNVSLHDSQQGYIRAKQRREVLAEIDQLSHLDPGQLPAASRYLMEIDFSTMEKDTLVNQSYWLFSMRAAYKAGRRASARARRATPRTARRPTNQILPSSRISNAIYRANRERYIVSGAQATLDDIHVDWGVRLPPSRTRPSPSTVSLERRDTRRRKPD